MNIQVGVQPHSKSAGPIVYKSWMSTSRHWRIVENASGLLFQVSISLVMFFDNDSTWKLNRFIKENNFFCVPRTIKLFNCVDRFHPRKFKNLRRRIARHRLVQRYLESSIKWLHCIYCNILEFVSVCLYPYCKHSRVCLILTPMCI